ncbi:TRAP transporter large permease subunit, partial [Dehalococcoidia bacterium]|nr:TRAP transporter large permease subunit [Dehalococcoidia bacterium]
MNLPLLLNTPEPMARMRVVTTRDRSDAALKTLHEEGVLHVEQSEELKPVERAAVEGARNRVSESLKYINEILSYIPEKEKVFLKEDLTTRYLRPFDEIESDTRSLYATLTDLYKKAAGLDSEIKRLREDNRYLRPLAEKIDLNVADLSFSGNYLFSTIFVLPLELHGSFLERIRSHTLHTIVVTTDNEAVVYVIARVEGKKDIEAAANDLGCRTLAIVTEDLTLEHFLGIIESRIQGLEGELTAVTRELESKTREHLGEVVLLKEVLSAESERLAILEKASAAKYVTMVEGWIPEAKAEYAMLHLKEVIDIVFVDVRAATESEDPPTKLNNFKPLRPFEVIVGLFGTPKYGEWDPTPLIAYSFAIFFGLMLGDVIYALGLMLAARFILPSFVDDPEADGFKLFQRLIYTSSVVALIVGALTGTALGDFSYTFLGIPSARWAMVEPIRATLMDPISFILVALVIGIIHVCFGSVRGGLAISTVVLGTILAATVGVIAASIAMLTLISLPSMVNRGYSRSLAAGTICAASGLGILIPPSIMLIVYGPMAGVSVGRLFFGAIVPGLILSGLYVGYITIRCLLQRDVGPPVPVEERQIPLTKKVIML